MKSMNTSVNKQQQSQYSGSMMQQQQGKVTQSKLQQRNKTRHRVKPAELYRTDFITAMKLPDNEVLDEEAYWLIRDQWKLDWEKGVQVPIKPTELNNPNYHQCQLEPATVATTTVGRALRQHQQQQQHMNFKLPKKYLCPSNDLHFDVNIHEAYITHRLVDNICRYDSDELDVCWLNRVNLEFQLMGVEQLLRINFERIIENFETQTCENLKEAIRTLESYSIEYDEEVVCDVCRSPDSEDTNEMVFCDGCNLCVHQACYGIDKIPKGSWLCAPCQLAVKPQCILCPNSGGAMKATRNLRNWCHVSCALWVPEVGFANPDKMEPIVNINKIPAARWQLICHLCKEKRGCCFQCSEKKCHSAFHITCAFKHGLEMQTILGHREDDIVFKAFCIKHSKKRQRYTSNPSYLQPEQHHLHHHHHHHHHEQLEAQQATTPSSSMLKMNNSSNHSPSSVTSLNTDLCKLNEQDRKRETEKRIAKLDFEFYKYASTELACDRLKLNRTHVDYVFNYWKLKRRYKLNRPLLIPKADEDLMNQSDRLLNARIKMFIHLRQDLERVRNLCYMVIKREKLKKRFFQLKTNIFYKQCEFIQKYGVERSGRTKDILLTNHENCVYDYLISPSSKKFLDDDTCNNNLDLITASSLIGDDDQDLFIDVDEHPHHDLIINSVNTDSLIQQQQSRLEREIADLKNLASIENLSNNNGGGDISNESLNASNCSGSGGGSVKRKSPTSLRSATNLVSNNKTASQQQQQQQKKNITNQIKSKYKNMQINSYLIQSQQQKSPQPTNGFIEDASECDSTPNSNYEKFKLIDNDLKLTPNGFIKCSNNNKKLKLTPPPAAPPTRITSNRIAKNRFSLRHSTRTTTTPNNNNAKTHTLRLRSPSIKRTSSSSSSSNNNNNSTATATFENSSY